MKKYIKIMMFAITLLGSFYTGLAIAGRYRASNAYMLATVLWHEARNIGYVEMQKVANVAMNRYSKFAGNSKDGYELEIGDILTASGAFDGSPAYLNARMTNDDILKHINLRGSDGTKWKEALNLANQALAGQLADITHGATHFHACNINQNGGYWAAMKNAGSGAYAIREISTSIHCFYRNIQMGAMRVNGHTFYEGKVKGNMGPIEAGGDGSGEGNGYYGDGSTGGGAYGGGAYGGGAAGSFVDLTFNDEEYTKKCEQALKENSAGSKERVAPNLFNTKILDRMADMLKTINKSLGKIYVIGRGLMCYASKDDPIDLGILKMINIPYWLAGAAIYISAFFITLSIGLFFVDVPLKLGFALLMLPISIALWPFEPTRGKLSENFSIIIRNAMLFTLVSIGISYGITLIESSVTYAINDVDFDKAISELSAVNMAKQFAFSGLNCLIIGFCLIYAYLLVQSSVNDYLNRLFPDNVFGGDSAVHQRAVQAFGNMATHTILPVASLATDIVRNQAGSLLIKGGEGLKNIGHNPNPRNQGGAGGPDGGSVEPVASDNTNTPTSDANEDATSPEIMPFAQHNPETATDKTSRPNRGSNPSRYGHHTQNRQQKNKSLADLQRARARQQQTQAENQNNNSAASSFADNEAMRNSAVEPDNAANGAGRSFKDAFMMGMKNADQGQYSLSVGTILKNAGKVANSPFELLNKKTYTQLAHLDELQAKQAQKAAARRQAEDALMPGMTKTERVIMRGGQLFMRTAKDTRNEAAYAAGSILSGLGKAIKPSENKKSWSDRWDKWQYDKEQEELEEQERQQREATLIDQFEERN